MPEKQYSNVVDLTPKLLFGQIQRLVESLQRYHPEIKSLIDRKINAAGEGSDLFRIYRKLEANFLPRLTTSECALLADFFTETVDEYNASLGVNKKPVADAVNVRHVDFGAKDDI